MERTVSSRLHTEPGARRGAQCPNPEITASPKPRLGRLIDYAAQAAQTQITN